MLRPAGLRESCYRDSLNALKHRFDLGDGGQLFQEVAVLRFARGRFLQNMGAKGDVRRPHNVGGVVLQGTDLPTRTRREGGLMCG